MLWHEIWRLLRESKVAVMEKCIIFHVHSKAPIPSVTYEAQWLDSNIVVTVANCQQHSDRAANGNVVAVLLAVYNSDYTLTAQSLCSHIAA